MIITGEPRGNGKQLGEYLLEKADNLFVSVFDIRGTSQPNDLKKSLLEMSLTSELTKSNMGLYHAQISPAPGEDKAMTFDQWLRAADILEQSLGYTDQKRVMVLHNKPDHIHMHIVWERYDHAKEIMIPDDFSWKAQDRARRQMEIEFGHQLTPLKNAKRPELKKIMADVWQRTTTGADFIREALKQGYVVAKGELKRPFLVIDDQERRSFNLVRQIAGVKSKDIDQRLKGEELPFYKEVLKREREKTPKNVPASEADQKRNTLERKITTAEKYNQQAAEAVKEQQKQNYIRELQAQLEQQRQEARGRGIEL